MHFLILLTALAFAPPPTHASSGDGKILSRSEYALPPFEKSGFQQTPEIHGYYEHTIRPEFEAMEREALVEEVWYESDGLRIKGYLLRARVGKAHRPVLVFNHGGNRDYGKLNINDLLWLNKLAQKGYLVAASQYRGVDGSEGNDEFGGADVDDVRNIALLAERLPEAASGRTYIAGHSRGGMMTYLTLKGSHEFKAAAVLAGECDLQRGLQDWPAFEKEVYEQLIPNYAADRVAALEARSACDWPALITTPVYLFQGDADQNVSPIQAAEMQTALERVHVEVRLEKIPGGDHSAFFRPPWNDRVVERIDEWFRAHP